MSNTTLLPCPHCGGEARVASYESCDCCGKPFNGAVACVSGNCGAEVSHFDTTEEAIAAWNRRAASPHPIVAEGVEAAPTMDCDPDACKAHIDAFMERAQKAEVALAAREAPAVGPGEAEAVAFLHRRRGQLVIERDLARDALRAHHNWHLAQEADENGAGGAEAYAESPLCDQTLTALSLRAERGEAPR